MKFRLDRTSSSLDANPEVVDPRVYTGEYIKYGRTKTGWFIDLNTLEDLIAFMKAQDFRGTSPQEFVIKPPNEQGYGLLEIYDSYRE